MLRQQYGDDAVVFSVRMPYKVFVSKLASGRSRERVKLFEEQFATWKSDTNSRTWFEFIKGNARRVWEFFQEVHLSGVEPKYIGTTRRV